MFITYNRINNYLLEFVLKQLRPHVTYGDIILITDLLSCIARKILSNNSTQVARFWAQTQPGPETSV